VPLQSDGAKPYALLFTQQGIDFFFVFFATWRFIPKDQARIYRMIPNSIPISQGSRYLSPAVLRSGRRWTRLAANPVQPV
jgi:hypothetical protein